MVKKSLISFLIFYIKIQFNLVLFFKNFFLPITCINSALYIIALISFYYFDLLFFMFHIIFDCSIF